jgi:hypothetical protein
MTAKRRARAPAAARKEPSGLDRMQLSQSRAGTGNNETEGPASRFTTVLEAHLWEAANILRGSPVDRTDLPLL